MTSLKMDLIFQIAYRILTIITPLVTSPYLSRVLGAKNLGVFSATYAYANYFILLSMLGVEYYGNRSIASCRDLVERKKTFYGIYSVQLLAAIVSIIVYNGTLIFVEPERKLIGLYQGIWVIAAGLDINWFFFGTQQFKLSATRSSIVKLLTIACVFLLVQNENDLLNYILVMSLGMLLNQIIMWLFLVKQIGYFKFSFRLAYPHIIPMMKLFIPILGLSVFQIMDKSMVDIFSDEINSGCYYNADRLINIPLGIITAMNTVMISKITREYNVVSRENIGNILEKSAELTISISAAVGFGIASIAHEFIPFFFGDEFLLCIYLVLGFAPVIMIKALEEFIRAQYLIPTHKDNIYIISVFFAAFVNVVANYFLIRSYGAFGAVIGTMIAEAVLLIVQMISVRKQVRFLKIFAKNSVYYVVGIVMFVIIRIMANYTFLNNAVTVVLSVFVGIIFYGGVVLIYGLLNPDSIYHFYSKELIGIVYKNRVK